MARLASIALGLLLLGLSVFLEGCMLLHARDGGCMGGHDSHSASAVRALCPVCGTTLKVDEKTPRATHGGMLVYFDTEEHLREFIKDPSKYPSRQATDRGTGHDHGAKP